MRHAYSPDDIETIADDVVARHLRPDLALACRTEILSALREDGAGTRISITVGRDSGSIVVTPRTVEIAGRLYRMSPSMPGLHDVMPHDTRALERLRNAVARHHDIHGTTLPAPHQITIRDGTVWHPAAVEADGVPHRDQTAHADDDEMEALAARIVMAAEQRRIHRDAIVLADQRIGEAMRRLTTGTMIQVDQIRRSGIGFDVQPPLVEYRVAVRYVTNTLRPEEGELVVTHPLGSRTWAFEGKDAYLAEQRRRAAMLRTGAGPNALMVEAAFAQRLLTMENRAPARRLLFGLSQGQDHHKTEWNDISHARAHNGRIVASLALAPGVRWRSGELRAKGAQLPETVLTALTGRPLDAVYECDLLKGAVIKSARRTKEGVVVRAEMPDRPYADIWKRLNGEA